MEKENYILIDTNIFIQCCLLELEQGEDLNVLQKLNALLVDDKFKILLPEVVELEFYNQLDRKTKKLKNHIGEYRKSINLDESLDEKVKTDMCESLKGCFDKRKENTEKVKKEIINIFSSNNTIKLRITPDSLVGVVRGSLSGEKPHNSGIGLNIQPDVLIVELAKNFLNSKKDYNFYFCSKNINDFAKDSKIDSSKIEISDSIKKYFSHLEYYTNLLQLLNDNFKTGFSKKSVKGFDEHNRIRERITINLPPNFNKQMLPQLSRLLETYKSGSTKVFLSIGSSRLETPYNLIGDNDTYHDLNEKVKNIFEKYEGQKNEELKLPPF